MLHKYNVAWVEVAANVWAEFLNNYETFGTEPCADEMMHVASATKEPLGLVKGYTSGDKHYYINTDCAAQPKT